MEPHHQRVIDEKRELDERLEKLVSFMASSDTYHQLDPVDRGLLRDQRNAMIIYTDTLELRIRRFE